VYDALIPVHADHPFSENSLVWLARFQGSWIREMRPVLDLETHKYVYSV